MRNVVEISVTDIIANGHYQGRVATNTAVIEEYREALVRGDVFPPIEVFEVDSQLYLTDGFHRYSAHCLAGRTSILAIVRPGTEAEALESALCANQTHGLPRSNGDKRLLVKRALEIEAFQGLSQRELAKKLRVSAPFVGKINRQAGITTTEVLADDAETSPQVKTFTPNGDPAPSRVSASRSDNSCVDAQTKALMDEIELLREGLAICERDSESLKDQLAATMISSTPEDREYANEYIKDLREKIRLLEIDLNSVKISRDTLMHERSEMIRQVRYWQRRAKKEGATE